MSTTADQRPAHQRTRSRGFSFKSDKSGHSQTSGFKQAKPKVDNLHETAQDKRRTHMSKGGKADPNAALNEAQPIADALADSTLDSLRNVRHVDSEGNPIVEPDLSNPTRPRWERPLDTIRSFDRAIEAEYKRKHSFTRGESFTDGQNGYASRRSSYYGGGHDNPRHSQVGGYYGSRNRDSFAEYGQSPMAGPTRNRFSQRMHSEPMVPRGYTSPYGYNTHGPVYPHNGYQQSRDTVNTGISSGSHSDPYSTDPSSENSSVDRVNATQQKSLPDPTEQYGFSGFGGAPIYEDGSLGYNVTSPPSQHRPTGSNPNGGYFPQTGIYQGGPPPVPAHGGPSSAQRGAPIKLGAGSGAPSAPLAQTSGNTRPALQHSESKRKSWFKRRFSKD